MSQGNRLWSGSRQQRASDKVGERMWRAEGLLRRVPTPSGLGKSVEMETNEQN